MADRNKNRGGNNRGRGQEPREQGIGNQQGTAQTGAQNAGGSRRETKEDTYNEDLRQSGRRSSKKES